MYLHGLLGWRPLNRRLRTKVCDRGLGLWPRLYAGSVCNDSVIEAAFVTLYKRTLPSSLPISRVCVRVCACVCLAAASACWWPLQGSDVVVQSTSGRWWCRRPCWNGIHATVGRVGISSCRHPAAQWRVLLPDCLCELALVASVVCCQFSEYKWQTIHGCGPKSVCAVLGYSLRWTLAVSTAEPLPFLW